MSDLTVTQVAKELGVCRKTVLTQILPKLSGVYSIGHGTTPRYRIPMASVVRFKNERQVTNKKPRRD